MSTEAELVGGPRDGDRYGVPDPPPPLLHVMALDEPRAWTRANAAAPAEITTSRLDYLRELWPHEPPEGGAYWRYRYVSPKPRRAKHTPTNEGDEDT